MKRSRAFSRTSLGVLVAAAAFFVAGPASGSAATSSAARAVTGAFTWHPPLDPQELWSNYSESVIDDTYIPLLTYRRVGGRAGSEVIPGLARNLPRITDGGRTYTLDLRHGLRYSDGEQVRASDFEFAVERMFQLESAPTYLYDDIAGAGRFEEEHRGGISGIVTDDRTGRIVIHLDRPERSFSRKLAMTFVAPVPQSTPMRFRSSRPPAATGPYMIGRSTRNGWTYQRNPEWASHDGVVMPQIPSGHLDRIKAEVVRDPAKAFREVERGRLDWISEELSGPAFRALRHRVPGRVRLEPTLSTEYFWFNTSEPPFDDVQVRRAVNYAVDRSVFGRLSGGQLSPTEQILPPDMPGYRKYSPYPHDLAKARRLIAAAHPSVRNVTLWAYGEGGNATPLAYAQYFAAVLSGLGFKVDLKTLGIERYFASIGTSGRPGLDAGIGNYHSNYPDPDDYIRETVGSRVAAIYNENLAQFTDPTLKGMIERLEHRPDDAVPEARYAALDRAYTRQAPWVPIGNVLSPLLVSKRIDLGKVVSNPSFGVELSSLQLQTSGG